MRIGRQYPDRSHFTIGQIGWETVADYSLDWSAQHAKARSVATYADVPLRSADPEMRA
jgi:hypothetical protein